MSAIIDCKLHGCRVVTAFPEGCPFHSPNPLRHLEAYLDRSYPAPGESNHKAALFAEIFETCKKCVVENSGHPQVRFLSESDNGRSA